MGRYILLEFDDNDPANKFIEMFKDMGDSEYDLKMAATVLAAHARISAVYTKPNTLCECPPNTKESNTSVKGTKFGWWVCKTCKKAKPGVGQPLRNTLDRGLDGTTRVGVLSLWAYWSLKDGKVVTKQFDDWKTRR